MKINKFFFSKIMLQKIIIKKYLSKYEYSKFFIRKNLKTLSKTFLVDNYSSLYELTFKKYIVLMRSRLLKIGHSVSKNICFYKHSGLLFFFFSVGRKKKKISLAKSFIKRLNFWSLKGHTVFLYKIRRGGFLGLSRGIISFIPKIHILMSNKNFIKHNKYILFYNFYGFKSYNCNFSLLNYSKITILQNFNNSSRKRRKLIFSKLKFILIQYKVLIIVWLRFFSKINFKSKLQKEKFLYLIFSKFIDICI